jgi:hypothetical protein
MILWYNKFNKFSAKAQYEFQLIYCVENNITKT